MNTPDFKIDHETHEVRIPADQFYTWLQNTLEQVKRIQGTLGPSESKAQSNAFSDAMQHMIDGGVAMCHGIHYRIKEGELQYMREYDEQPWVAWVPSPEPTIDWAIRQKWKVI